MPPMPVPVPLSVLAWRLMQRGEEQVATLCEELWVHGAALGQAAWPYLATGKHHRFDD